VGGARGSGAPRVRQPRAAPRRAAPPHAARPSSPHHSPPLPLSRAAPGSSSGGGGGGGGLFGGLFGGGQQASSSGAAAAAPPPDAAAGAPPPPPAGGQVEFPPFQTVAKAEGYDLRFYEPYAVVEMDYRRRENGYLTLGGLGVGWGWGFVARRSAVGRREWVWNLVLDLWEAGLGRRACG
jgi:hypothetical protein